MFFTEPMKSVELLVLKSDADAVMRFLGSSGSLQLVAEPREAKDLSPEERETADVRTRVQALARFLGLDETAEPAVGGTPPDRATLARRAAALMDEARPLIDEESALLQKRLSLRQAVEELGAFSAVKVPLSELRELSYLAVRFGSVAPERLNDVVEALGRRAVVIPLEKPGSFLAVSSRKGRWALDSELARFEFQSGALPADHAGVPGQGLAVVHEELSAVERSLAELERRKSVMRAQREAELRSLLSELETSVTIDNVKLSLASSGSVQKVTGWVPRRRLREVLDGVQELTHGRAAATVSEPRELPGVREGKVKVPVSTPHRRIARSFERMVFSYGIPLYGTVDPTPFVAVMFVLLFAIMFGDVGQGFVGVVLGLLINSGRIRSFETYRRKHFGTTFLVVGVASMLSGFLYGSLFANEHVLEPLSRAVTQALIGRPLSHVISLEGFQKIIMFFGVTIGIGAIINSVGLVFNIMNRIRQGNWSEALLSKTGAAGALFFWYVLFVAIRVLMGGGKLSLHPIDGVVLAVALLALAFRHPIEHLATGHRPLLKDGVFAFVMEGIVEILESAIYYVSNSVSFLRVAAFGLAHTVLSTIIFLLSDMVGGAPGGLVFRILVILIGNSIIIVLEGLIVTIQVVRLQYYEFFSKFFSETGEQFSPFILRSSGGSR